MTGSPPRSPAEPILGGGPRRRPPAAIRAIVGLVGLTALTVAGMLLLSDRAPGILLSTFGERAERLWERIDRAGAPTALGERAASQPDFVIHVAIWATVTALAVLTVWSWRATVLVAGAVVAVSVLIELGQGVWSTTREVQRDDIAGNAVGVVAGVVVAATVMLAWSGVAAVLGRPRSRPVAL